MSAGSDRQGGAPAIPESKQELLDGHVGYPVIRKTVMCGLGADLAACTHASELPRLPPSGLHCHAKPIRIARDLWLELKIAGCGIRAWARQVN